MHLFYLKGGTVQSGITGIVETEMGGTVETEIVVQLEPKYSHVELERVLEANNSKEKIQKLEYENELDQKQAQISILEIDKELAASISLRNKLIIGFLFSIIVAISIMLFYVLKSRKAKIKDNLLIKS